MNNYILKGAKVSTKKDIQSVNLRCKIVPKAELGQLLHFYPAAAAAAAARTQLQVSSCTSPSACCKIVRRAV